MENPKEPGWTLDFEKSSQNKTKLDVFLDVIGGLPRTPDKEYDKEQITRFAAAMVLVNLDQFLNTCALADSRSSPDEPMSIPYQLFIRQVVIKPLLELRDSRDIILHAENIAWTVNLAFKYLHNHGFEVIYERKMNTVKGTPLTFEVQIPYPLESILKYLDAVNRYEQPSHRKDHFNEDFDNYKKQFSNFKFPDFTMFIKKVRKPE